MPDPILLSSTDYPAVRAMIDISLTVEMLPDATLAMEVFSGDAVRYVKSLDPLWATRTGDDLGRLKSASIMLTAANILPSVPQIIMENIAGFHYQVKSTDIMRRVELLKDMAIEAIAQVTNSPDDILSLMPTMFTLASGTRGRI